MCSGNTPMSDFEFEEPPASDDGYMDTTAFVSCPYCGAEVEVVLDPGGGPVQEYVEDCEVCCSPWQVVVRYSADGDAEVSLSREAD
jgi:hypothetical protein